MSLMNDLGEGIGCFSLILGVVFACAVVIGAFFGTIGFIIKMFWSMI